jgi:DNA-directed RNA polymerase subunit RPC12/RpoP
MTDSDPADLPHPDLLVACARCGALVVTVEMRTAAVVYWRCVSCGHIFVQRIAPPEEPPSKKTV